MPPWTTVGCAKVILFKTGEKYTFPGNLIQLNIWTPPAFLSRSIAHGRHSRSHGRRSGGSWLRQELVADSYPRIFKCLRIPPSEARSDLCFCAASIASNNTSSSSSFRSMPSRPWNLLNRVLEYGLSRCFRQADVFSP